LDKWGCSPDKALHILGMKKSTYYKNKDKAHTPKLSGDQIERISYILNIHAALRVVFDNPKNVYEFMFMQNFNLFFNGSAPLEIIASGHFGALYETFKRIDSLRDGGLWIMKRLAIFLFFSVAVATGHRLLNATFPPIPFF
jgi:uncharacterized protein (DUF2384 family)